MAAPLVYHDMTDTMKVMKVYIETVVRRDQDESILVSVIFEILSISTHLLVLHCTWLRLTAIIAAWYSSSPLAGIPFSNRDNCRDIRDKKS